MTRLNSKFTRVYINGYDVSGTARNCGTWGAKVSLPTASAYSDEVENTVPGKANIVCGPINAFLAPSATVGLHELMNSGSAIADILIADASIAVPAAGDPVFAWRMQESEYMANGEDIVGVNIAFPDAAYNSVLTYDNPFGYLLHAKSEVDAVNTAAGVDFGAQTTKGGWLMYQIFDITGAGTVTLSIEHAAISTYAALTGATSGAIATASAPISGIVALSSALTVEKKTRWQIAFGGDATKCTFALAFIRGV